MCGSSFPSLSVTMTHNKNQGAVSLHWFGYWKFNSSNLPAISKFPSVNWTISIVSSSNENKKVENSFTLSISSSVCDALIKSKPFLLLPILVILMLHPVEYGACKQLFTTAAIQSVTQLAWYLCTTNNSSVMIPSGFSWVWEQLCQSCFVA